LRRFRARGRKERRKIVTKPFGGAPYIFYDGAPAAIEEGVDMKRNRWVPLIVALFFVPAIFFHLGIPGGTVLAAPKEVKVKNSPAGGCKACHKDPTSLVPK
jgi:hypothetical protein